MNARDKLKNFCALSQERVTKLLAEKHRTNAVSQSEEFVAAVSSALETSKEISGAQRNLIRRELKVTANTLAGVQNGLSTSELSRRGAAEALKKVAKSLSNVEEFLDTPQVTQSDSDATSDVEHVSKSSNDPAVKAAQDAIATKAKNEKVGDGNDDELKAALDSAAKECSELPSRMKYSYTIQKVPLIPVFTTNRYNPDLYKNLGFSMISVEGYPIIFGQMLLMVSKKQAQEEGISAFEFAEQARDAINEHAKTKISFVSDVPQANPKNADLQMFWVMESDRLTRFLRTSGLSGSVKWGLPFRLN